MPGLSHKTYGHAVKSSKMGASNKKVPLTLADEPSSFNEIQVQINDAYDDENPFTQKSPQNKTLDTI